MTLEPPQAPTPPAPAIRPTPPKPPRIDRTPFANDSPDVGNEQPVDEPSDEPVDEPTQEVADEPTQEFHGTRNVDDPESMARDAVAHGSGALTRRTVDRGDDTPQQNQPTPAQVGDGQSDYDRGQDVLRQFRDQDARDAQQQREDFQPQTVTEQPRTFKPTINYHEGHGGLFWIATIIFAVIVGVVVVKKFLFTDKPALTKSELFADSTERLQAAVDKVKQPVTPPKVSKPAPTPEVKPTTKPVTKPARSSDDNDKGKHFEIRV